MSSELTQEQIDQINLLILEITNVPEGYPCFLCETTGCKECVWDDVHEQVIAMGNKTILGGDDDHSMALKHTAAHFTCYHYYAIVVSSWSSFQGRICLPTCIEQKIK